MVECTITGVNVLTSTHRCVDTRVNVLRPVNTSSYPFCKIPGLYLHSYSNCTITTLVWIDVSPDPSCQRSTSSPWCPGPRWGNNLFLFSLHPLIGRDGLFTLTLTLCTFYRRSHTPLLPSPPSSLQGTRRRTSYSSWTSNTIPPSHKVRGHFLGVKPSWCIKFFYLLQF